ncbi:hypothetical protein BiPBO1_66 [Brucella phage BiPBO1]|uniref:hypothetical protein n=1 Tax=Brucella phage BiPBO1 TaxID=1718278 RepID=UPI0002FFF2C4|nr:hypothetical protein [Brucella inopinata]YP_009304094.1 hypothetical protein BJD47_gp66 [Brucella phage BiPBO1]ALJ98280.1 hypothetical protein BiPBO1_66 [Brucella phage BiPBO1]KEY04127.1 hypothetical protein IL59_0212020 [Brucella suis bv. 4 str. 40]
MSDREKIDGLAGTLLSSCANFAALMLILKRKGVLTDAEEREMYEEALLFLEVNQGSDQATNHIYEMAREVIEAQLRD